MRGMEGLGTELGQMEVLCVAFPAVFYTQIRIFELLGYFPFLCYILLEKMLFSDFGF